MMCSEVYLIMHCVFNWCVYCCMHVGVISKVHQWCVQHLYLHENYYATISVEVRRLNDTLLRTVNKCFWILYIHCWLYNRNIIIN